MEFPETTASEEMSRETHFPARTSYASSTSWSRTYITPLAITRCGQLFSSLRSGWSKRPLRWKPFGRGLDQADRPFLVAAVEHPVGPQQRALARTAVGPFHLARLVVQARQDARVAAATVEAAVHQDHAAVVVLHFFGEVDLLRRESVAGRCRSAPARRRRRRRWRRRSYRPCQMQVAMLAVLLAGAS